MKYSGRVRKIFGMKWIGRLIVSTCAIAAALSASEASARKANQSAGLAVARQMCSECHAVDRNDGPSPILDAASFTWIANQRGMTANFLSVEIRRKHRTPMPIFDLNANEMRDIIAYILSLKRAK